MLGGGIDGLARDGTEAGQGGDVDHVSSTVPAHRPDRRNRAVDGAERVDLEHKAPGLVILVPGGPGDEDTGVVDPHIQASGMLKDGVTRGVDCTSVRSVDEAKKFTSSSGFSASKR